ncbi:Tripartite-type tricarboxylate transporter, receptor component TctC [Enhydrobacter aerosaccus]|uniref:Tripartite-type tricarboxylate transporter, receptor component TctC n=2 Tax=Enhydrobacter aerosaccus TaxID=225324 RepID=A0A1T4SVA6_9HYPH|nr:Tripartite-type tricarboxylate transporter, receptor component TctC [Enhydrobacter aerosaccus]
MGCKLRSMVLAWAVAALAQTPAAAPAQAQSWPSNPVKIVVPFGPGGPADVYARILAQGLTESLGQQFIVDDKPGAGGIIGTDMVAKAAPDGYTLLMMSNTQTTNETLFARKPYVLMRDLAAVAPVNSSDLVMVVHPSVKARTLQEFIALAKANPGMLTYASSGPGTPYHMAGELFKAMSGTDILHVPHKNSGEARTDVMGGHVQMMFDAVTAMKGTIEAGEVRALATTGLTRSTVLPDVPTLNEAGVPGYEATIWLGVMAPIGTPKDIVERLNAEIGKIVANPQTRKAWAEQGAVPMIMTPAAFDAFLRRDIEKWAKVVELSGARIQ